MSEHVCTICSKPVLHGESRHGFTNNHYDCEYPNGYKSPLELVKEAEQQMNAALFNLTGRKPRKPPARPGDGSVAKRVQAKLAAALREELGSEPHDFFMWVQAPAHRGPRNDLAVWGGHCEMDRVDVGCGPIDNVKITFSSWSTMTECAKGSLKLSIDGVFSYDVFPT